MYGCVCVSLKPMLPSSHILYESTTLNGILGTGYGIFAGKRRR